ncbi:uncharacterized protein N7477_001532 [Penicillium maclennaniae]|uniref:uncharacterized protein n=1 Tax=Penicillium maclennaniae TaxID=1343394 RepID=UPI0025406175|nr:uncharacterized protein N7477_001532 [Penicillium maclennaniae]KAJ5681592.1 hypothetical protein N7477_001532 [Penicillium maclennaniae]
MTASPSSLRPMGLSATDRAGLAIANDACSEVVCPSFFTVHPKELALGVPDWMPQRLPNGTGPSAQVAPRVSAPSSVSSLPMTNICQPPSVEDMMLAVLDIHTDSFVRAKSALSVRGLKRDHVPRAEIRSVQFGQKPHPFGSYTTT